MTRILVVDDSASDRMLLTGLLAEDPSLTIFEAVDGNDALLKIEEHSINLVLTDLVMPNMNGIELLHELRKLRPSLPVIVATSQGAADSADEALALGASHFIHKDDAAETLLGTVRSVVAVRDRTNGFDSLQGFMRNHSICLEIENDNSMITPVIGLLQEQIVNPVFVNDTDRLRIGISLEESLANALYHGNLEISSELREKDDGRGYYQLAEARKKCEPYADRRIRVFASRTDDEIHVSIRDEGCGFDPTTLPDPTDPANMERVHGRGLLLIRTFMDEVNYNEVGNEITMIKRVGSGDGEDCCEAED